MTIRRVRRMEFHWALAAAPGVLLFGTLQGITVAIVHALELLGRGLDRIESLVSALVSPPDVAPEKSHVLLVHVVESLHEHLDGCEACRQLVAAYAQAVAALDRLGLAGLAVICTALAFVLFFQLIAEVGPARATVITYVNPAFEAFFGYRASELLGRPVITMLFPEDEAAASMFTAAPARLLMRARCKDGSGADVTVSIGMVQAFRFSGRLGLCEPHLADHVARHLGRAGLPTGTGQIPGALPPPAKLLDIMHQDKKAAGGKLVFILARSVGDAFVARDIAEADVLKFLEEWCN